MEYLNFRDQVKKFEEKIVADTLKNAKGNQACLLYTSDAADERSSVDLGGSRIIKKKIKGTVCTRYHYKTK